MNLHYLIGDATDPIVKPALICHVCNSIGGWGRGFVLALSAKNKAPEIAYKKWYNDSPDTFILGSIQIIPFADNVWVANMIAQKGIRWEGKIPPIRYDALEQCLNSAYKYAKDKGLILHAPRLGAVLSGGDWLTIEAIIKKTMTVETYIYTLESQKDRWPTQYENIIKKDDELNNSKKYIKDVTDSATPEALVDDSPRDVDGELLDNSADLNDLFK